YENACALTRGSKKRGAEKAAEYEAALDELEIAVADPAALVWARRDPSLAELHDVDVVGQACRTAGETAEEKAATAAKAFEIVSRFKGLVGDPVPAGFLSLSPFASYREALALRGIHNPARLRQTRGRELRSELGITRGEVARAAEELGFDAFFRSDHYLTMSGSGLPGPTDAWITLAGLARETSRIRLGTLMSPVTFRLPGPLAIAVAQVDQMSGGRAELGL